MANRIPNNVIDIFSKKGRARLGGPDFRPAIQRQRRDPLVTADFSKVLKYVLALARVKPGAATALVKAMTQSNPGLEIQVPSYVARAANSMASKTKGG